MRLSCSRTGFDPRSGLVSWVRFLSTRIPVKCQEASGPQGPRISFGRYNHPFRIHLVRMNECINGVYCLSCLCCLGSAPGIELIPHPGRPYMSLCDQKKYVCEPELIPSPDRPWLCKAQVE